MIRMRPIRKIVADVDDDGNVVDVTFYFHDQVDPEEPMGASEFVGSTKRALNVVEDVIAQALQFYSDGYSDPELMDGAEARALALSVGMSESGWDRLLFHFTVIDGILKLASAEKTAGRVPGAPDWFCNYVHAVAGFAGVSDYKSIMFVLHGACKLVGEFIDETKDMPLVERMPVISGFVEMCKTIGDFTALWGEEKHPSRTVIQMHRRCVKLIESLS